MPGSGETKCEPATELTGAADDPDPTRTSGLVDLDTLIHGVHRRTCPGTMGRWTSVE
jgi:hypothetical protein